MLPPGTRTAFSWFPRPESVALDLAVQAAGLVSVPVSDSSDVRHGEVWLSPEGLAVAPPAGLKVVALPAWSEGGSLPDRPAGAVLVEGREVGQEELTTAADRIQSLLAPGGPEREIAVAGRGPERWPDRALLSWATAHGAALLLAPSPASLVSCAVWARPTLFHGTAAELAALRRAVEAEHPPFWARKTGRLPFGRLRTVLWSGEEEPDEEELRFWRGRGVRVERGGGEASLQAAIW